MPDENKNENCHHHNGGDKGFWGGAYFLTIIGAAVYFIEHAAGFWAGVLGVLKALVWPALVIYKVLETLKF
ncbi:MAG: hypothetical protein ABSG94_11900 [Brevinematales bacterium]|jgi:hypothetical protein